MEREATRPEGGPAEPLYALGERVLDVQERDVANLRARMPGVAAAAAVGATLLAPAATAGHHPAGFVEGAAFTVGLLGLAAVVAGLIGVLWSRPLVFAVSPRAVAAEAHESGLMSDATAFDIALAGVLEAMSAKNAVTLRKLHRCFALALVGMALEVAGLGLCAGVAS